MDNKENMDNKDNITEEESIEIIDVDKVEEGAVENAAAETTNAAIDKIVSADII